jgi:heme/copper-type cytochrome/quinol oxidase subunit 4
MGTGEILLNVLVAAFLVAGMIWVLRKTHPHNKE